ncbi:MAG: TolC family protein [Ginsengibacter sp.]
MNVSLKYCASKKRLVLGVLFLLFSVHHVNAQTATSLTLREAIDLGLKKSHVLKASSARNDQAGAIVQQAMDNKLPNASISGSYLRLAHPDISLKTKAFNGGSDSSSRSGSIPNVNQAMYGIANISYPIFTGGKIKYGIESAKFLQKATLLDADNDKESVILNIINAYVNFYKASVTVNVVKENLAQSQVRDSVFSRLEQNGLLARNDLLKAQLQSSNISLSLLDAESNLKIAGINLGLLLGVSEHSQFIPDTLAFQKHFALKTLDTYEQLASQNRKDMQSLSYREKAANSAISLAKASKYPSIALTGGYVAANIPKVLTIVNAVNIGIGVKYDIASLWKSKANIVQAKARVEETIANEAQLSDAVKLEINNQFENYLLSRRKIEVYEKAIVQSEENYRITKNKYDNALVNTTDLLDANVLLLQSKIELAVAKADVLLAYGKLLKATGTLTPDF